MAALRAHEFEESRLLDRELPKHEVQEAYLTSTKRTSATPHRRAQISKI
jgi:hypothetical protein